MSTEAEVKYKEVVVKQLIIWGIFYIIIFAVISVEIKKISKV